MSLQEMFSYVKHEVCNLDPSDKDFTVSDLFKGYVWNRVPKKDRILLGALVLSWANNEGLGIIIPTAKTPQGQQKYRKP